MVLELASVINPSKFTHTSTQSAFWGSHIQVAAKIAFWINLDVPNTVTYLNQIPIFEWYVVRCGFQNGCHKYMCLKEIGLFAQNV